MRNVVNISFDPWELGLLAAALQRIVQDIHPAQSPSEAARIHTLRRLLNRIRHVAETHIQLP